MTAAATLNPRLQEIVDDFAAVGDKDRLQLLLEFSEELPRLPDRYAEEARAWQGLGATVIGGCCGTTPDTIAAVARALK